MKRNKDAEAHERFRAYYRGWTNGAGNNSQDHQFVNSGVAHVHDEYHDGYSAGVLARRAMENETARRVGYTPIIFQTAQSVFPKRQYEVTLKKGPSDAEVISWDCEALSPADAIDQAKGAHIGCLVLCASPRP